MKESIPALILLISLLCGCTSTPDVLEPTTEQLYSEPKLVQYNYTVGGQKGSFNFTVYNGLSNYLGRIQRTIYCVPRCPSNASIQLRYIDNIRQEIELEKFAETIDNLTESKEIRAKIAISLIQNIEYDESVFQTNTSEDRYPYQVLYDARGVCGEKSRLLAYILRHQGYATSLLHYNKEKHAALGVACPLEISHQSSGYCFVETTIPAIPTFDNGNYPGFGKLQSAPEILKLSNGTEYDFRQEYLDAREWTRLEAEIKKSGGYLKTNDFREWTQIKDKYGIPIE